MDQPMEGVASSSTDPTVAEPPLGDATGPVVNLPAHAREDPFGMVSLDKQATCKDTVAGETLVADLVGDPA